MIPIDERADTFPVGLQGTPFEEVYKALRAVAASVWAVDPTVYRAGMAWGWYALNAPDKLAAFRDVVVAALISAFAPMIKDNQTDAELVEYLRLWRAYKPTFGALGELFSVFGASVEVLPISDEESQSVVPVSDTRLAFYLRITGIDFSRPLSLSEAVEIARRATPLGARPFAYYAIPSRITVPCGPAPEPAFVFVENNVVAELPSMQYLVVDETTGNIIYGGQFALEYVHIAPAIQEEPSPAYGEIRPSIQEVPEMVYGAGEFVPPQPEPDYLDVFFYFSQNNYGSTDNGVTFGQNDYWASLVIDSVDRDTLRGFGVTLDPVDTAYGVHYVVSRTSLNDFAFTPIGLYSGVRTGERDVDMSNFYCGIYASADPGTTYGGVCIWSRNAYNLVCKTWKCRIARNS